MDAPALEAAHPRLPVVRGFFLYYRHFRHEESLGEGSLTLPHGQGKVFGSQKKLHSHQTDFIRAVIYFVFCLDWFLSYSIAGQGTGHPNREDRALRRRMTNARRPWHSST